MPAAAYNPPTSMPLAAGTRLGRYEIVSALGAGGMGEVYRARDSTLARDVALKMLPDAVARNPDRLARFEREARVLASLSHAHIAQVHGFEDHGGVRVLVMELVEGSTLAERLARGALPLRESLEIGRQIADALLAAHDQGIVHRDLKPANVVLASNGTAKVLDFGLAKTGSGLALDPSESGAATRATMMTEPGMVLGTASYMSPEQAMGADADRRTDVWAFGCVLYEMLTARRAFDGTASAEILAAVLKQEPDWTRLPASTPPGIRRLLRRSLQKDPRARLRDMGDARLEIDEVLSGATAEQTVPVDRSGRRPRLTAAIVALVAVASALGGFVLRRSGVVPAEARLEMTTPPSRDASVALSPDGRTVVFVALSGNEQQLWMRPLASSVAQPLAGTERGTAPFWKPDGRSIGFWADTQLRRLDLDDGTVRTIVKVVEVPMGASWNTDGTIVLALRPGVPIMKVADTGGEPTAVTRFEASRHSGYRAPAFLPDGRHFLFYATGTPEARGVHLGDLEQPDAIRLFEADGPAAYAATGHLLFLREGKLLAQAFDVNRLQMDGSPFVVAEAVPARTTLSSSPAGPIVYRSPPPDSGERQLTWLDRSGGEIQKEVYADGSAMGPSLSPDGRYVGVFRFVNGNMDLWSYDRVRTLWERVTEHPSDDIYTLWSRDGTRIAFASNRGGRLDLYWKLRTSPAGQDEELLLSTPEAKWPMDLSRDGRYLLYTSLNPETGPDIYAWPLEEERKASAIVRTEHAEQLPQLSPDGRWLAYQSNRTGRFEVYLRPFPGPGTDVRVTAEGGTQPRWNPTGAELFYIAPNDDLTAVPLVFTEKGQRVEPGGHVRLFATTVGSTAPNTNRHQYAVSPDGQSFVLNAVVGATSASPVTVLLNWRPMP
jgi:eukaryotic-like serine/threonine-protein kinase